MDNTVGTPLFISGDQQLVLSQEDAAQLLAQAGIQLGDNEQVIIGDVGDTGGIGGAQDVSMVEDEAAALVGSEVLGQQQQSQFLSEIGQGSGVGVGDTADGQVLYIDPNDPQAAELLQQAGLRLADDGTVTSLPEESPIKTEPAPQPPDPEPQTNAVPVSSTATGPVVVSPKTVGLGTAPKAQAKKSPAPVSQAKSSFEPGPDQQQVMYSVTGEDGRMQQYMMLCPKDMDQNLLIQTLVKQISSDPNNKGGKKTIKITQQRGATPKITGLPPGSRVVSQTYSSGTSTASKGGKKTVKVTQQRDATPKITSPPPPPPSSRVVSQTYSPVTSAANNVGTPAANNERNVIDITEISESVVSELPFEPADGGTRVYVKCNYCPNFRSTLNGDTWEAILNHILPVAKEEIQTTFYGDLSKHFIRSLRIQINGKQTVRTATGVEVPQCEVVLSHSLICKKTKREFVVHNPDADFVAGLARHIRLIQPGNSGRGNSLLCIFCNTPFTHEDYLRHIHPHLDAILATLNCFAGAYCAQLYTNSIRALRHCHICEENEASDLRFLPCTKFSNTYSCVKRLQFGIDCFREHYGDSGFLRLNTSAVAKCSVCKNSQQVYCAVFHISTEIVNEDETEHEDVATQLAVCVICQKQFINIVMKEQGFDERLKHFQLKNMEQLCSVLRVILNQASALCEQKKTLIYTVHENTNNPNSSVHLVKAAEATQYEPVTKLMSLAESEIAASRTKAFFVCDMCLFTTDLTSLVAAEDEREKNDMLLAIVLEHLVPHTESLMSVIASTSSYQTFHLKYEIVARVQEHRTFRKIILSLQKKFKSQMSKLAKQTKQPNKLSILAQSGCNTTLLGTYAECKLCSKFSFPDFRLLAGDATLNPQKQEQQQQGAGEQLPKKIQLCENCVETVLNLCLPTEPECLQEGEECLALEEPKLMGHRLVLSNNLKKWLSLDGVNIIKRTVDEFEETKTVDCITLYLEALKRHITAVLKTCQGDAEITSCSAGFCIDDAFLEKENNADETTAAALASLEQQIGMPIRQKREEKAKEIQVTVLGRKEKPKVPAKLTPLNRLNTLKAANGTPSPAPPKPIIVYGRGKALDVDDDEEDEDEDEDDDEDEDEDLSELDSDVLNEVEEAGLVGAPKGLTIRRIRRDEKKENTKESEELEQDQKDCRRNPKRPASSPLKSTTTPPKSKLAKTTTSPSSADESTEESTPSSSRSTRTRRSKKIFDL